MTAGATLTPTLSLKGEDVAVDPLAPTGGEGRVRGLSATGHGSAFLLLRLFFPSVPSTLHPPP